MSIVGWMNRRHRREVSLWLILSYLDANFRDLIAVGERLYLDIFHREVTENPCFLIDKMCMSRFITLIVGLPIDTRETSEYSFFRHSLDISIDSGSTDLWLMDTDLLIDIISGEMTTCTGIADDVSILMLTHWRKCQELCGHYENFSRKSKIYNENYSHYSLTSRRESLPWECFYVLTCYTMKKENPSLSALNHLIAAYIVTAQNARFCHWNVVWPHFEDDHEFFWELYEELSESVDLFAERIRALCLHPLSSFSDILQETQLQEYSLPVTARQMQKNMLVDYEHIGWEMRVFAESTSDDPVTQDIIIGELRQIDKRAWMLRSMLGE